MEEVYYLKEIERIKSILQDYYNKDFNSDEEDFYVNKSNKELIEQLIVRVKRDDAIPVSNKRILGAQRMSNYSAIRCINHY